MYDLIKSNKWRMKNVFPYATKIWNNQVLDVTSIKIKIMPHEFVLIIPGLQMSPLMQ